jgi:hypothetical protein
VASGWWLVASTLRRRASEGSGVGDQGPEARSASEGSAAPPGKAGG